MQNQERFYRRWWRRRDNHKRDSDSQEDEIGPVALKKNLCNDDCDGEGLPHWRFVKDNRADNNVNNSNVGDTGVTTADDREDGGNGKEERIDNDGDGGDD